MLHVLSLAQPHSLHAFLPMIYSIQAKLKILGFHKWFQEFVPGWIVVATDKCESRIRQAIEMDEIVKITDELQISVSAVDTNGFLLQMATFWGHLDWPVASEAYGYAGSLIQNMCNCVNIFIQGVYSGLSPEDLHDEQGRFKASEKVRQQLINEHNTMLSQGPFSIAAPYLVFLLWLGILPHHCTDSA